MPCLTFIIILFTSKSKFKYSWKKEKSEEKFFKRPIHVQCIIYIFIRKIKVQIDFR